MSERATALETADPRPRRFEIGTESFLLDGEPIRVIAGALHYFRVHPGQWSDRIAKAKMLGLNAIETYVPWNAHEPQPGQVSFDGQLDLPHFLDLVAEAGLLAIVRPGPYICAEWDGGGLPGWLFRDPDVGVRTSEEVYLREVRSWFERLLPLVAQRQVTRGGPVIMLQVENEYGAYGDDEVYLKSIVSIMREAGIEVPLVTCDQADPTMFDRGGLGELHKTATFGSRSPERLAILREAQPEGPLMCMEYWNGWFDHWGAPHHVTDAAAQAADLDDLLAAGASVNLYMVHGGTNFGLTNGANDKGIYQPTVTSYDYDAPLSEDGWPTAKYWAFREAIARHAAVPDETPGTRPVAPTPPLRLERSASLVSVVERLGRQVETSHVPTSDELGHYQGFTLYAVDLPARTAAALLSVAEVRDRAIVAVDGVPLGTLSRGDKAFALPLPAGGPGELTLLVEDQGRVNYGARIGEPKGVLGPVLLDDDELRGWRTRPLRLDPDVVLPHATPVTTASVAGPAFAVASFDLESAADLHLDTGGWGKGIAWVNGFCLGRYWSRGPQRTLYVPGPATHPGANTLVLFELHGGRAEGLSFRPAPELGPTEI